MMPTTGRRGELSTRVRTALVTGANRGIGFETCRQLAKGGLHVLLTSRGRDGEVAARSLAREGLPVEYRQLDVTDPAMVATLVDRLRDEGQGIDVLVNNAGVLVSGADAASIKQTLEVNLFGALRVTDAFLRIVPGGGNVVMVSSGLGQLSGLSGALREKLTLPGLTRDDVVGLMRSYLDAALRGGRVDARLPSSAYGVSKAGMNALVRVLAPTLAARRIRLNAVSPGWVRTDMGGSGAPRSVKEGAASVVGAALPEEGPTGGFFQDGEAIAW